MAVKSATAAPKAKAGPKKDAMAFTFADTIAGYVKRYDRNSNSFTIETSDGREFTVGLTSTTNAQLVRNLGEPYADATAQLRDMLVPGRYLFTYGVFYPKGDTHVYDAKQVTFPGAHAHDFVFEKPDWWVKQIYQMADFYYRAQFGAELARVPRRRRHDRQQGRRSPGDGRDLRLIYGLSTAYHMTGEERFLKAAETGVEYLREHLRNVDTSEGITYWYHAIEVHEPSEKKILASEFGDDFQAIPAYERYRPGRARPALPHHRRQAHQERHRRHDLALRAVLLRPRVRRLLVAHRPDLVRRQERRARPQPGSQELELGRRPRAGLPHQRLARDRRQEVRGHARLDRRRHRAATRTTSTARSSRSNSTRTGATT